MDDACEICGNHTLTGRHIGGAQVDECETCGHISGPADVVELLELQREAEDMGCSRWSYPLAQFVDALPGIRLLGDSGGDTGLGTMPFVAFEATDHRTTQLENLGQALRLMRNELEFSWIIEFTYDFQMGFELRTARDGKKTHTPEQIAAARADLLLMWRRLQGYTGLAWWETPEG